ncbi:MAG: hypothetical protein ACYDGR_09905, partial [Candidatus Dormibacteria bacterium]
FTQLLGEPRVQDGVFVWWDVRQVINAVDAYLSVGEPGVGREQQQLIAARYLAQHPLKPPPKPPVRPQKKVTR